ncbi:dienelactone hydrolase family protein [Nannocystis sp. SCPEA4]|uniref:dienelactone hydrolase family protein n=1 Tax=Nannocystis sp. SCPEA4 TaxID=2996787 RepID=UPI002271B46B|nr:dienelactone hydrolase family protein [Nannocystis sp. SCPEA4]MCY1059029.1 dienelactone hydrolase family protein [Nannocystis sp. SCPEA4]
MVRRFAAVSLLNLVWVSAVLAAALAGPAEPRAAEPPKQVEFVSRDPAKTTLHGYLFKPEGEGPFPAVIALHGCGGLFSSLDPERLSQRHDDWARRLVDEGYVVMFPDSFGQRGIDSLCDVRDRPLTVGRRARDAQGAAAWLARQPFVDPERLAVLGWSHGGTSVLSFAGRAEPKNTDIRTAVAFYPGCQRFADNPTWEPKIPITILIGKQDDWTPVEPCRDLAKRFPDEIELVEYPRAVHGFDAPDQRVHPITGLAYTASDTGMAHVGTEPEARRDSIRLVKQELERAFARNRE